MNTKQRRPGWWYPHLFVAGFGVVIAVNAVLVYFAVSTFTGLETESAYEKGLAYNEALAAAQAQDALGWTATARMLPADMPAPAEGQRAATVTVTLRDDAGSALDGLEVRAVLTRPTTTGFDQEVGLEGRGGGRYVATVVLPMPGQWDLRVAAAGAVGTFQMTKRVLLP